MAKPKQPTPKPGYPRGSAMAQDAGMKGAKAKPKRKAKGGK